MRNENEPSGMARRGFLAAGLAATAVLPLLSGPAMATADAAVEDPDQLFANGLFAAADRGYARLLAADPGDARAWAQRGNIALLLNRLTPAERFLGAALRLAPADQNSALWLAQCHVRRADFPAAVPLFTRAGDQIDATYYSAVTGSPYRVAQ